jgi:aminoglycoside phosphotransferase (APT) family kinase protein
VVKTRQVVRRMLRWNPELPPGRFSRLIAARGVATLDTWVDGTPCDPADPALATRAGELLGRVHTAIGVDLLGVSHPERIAQREKIATWTEELFAGGRLTRQRADAVAAALRDAEPEHARWGLQHGDFCIENLLEVDGELRCIDNPTVRASLLDLDLAQAFYRWPLSAAERERFLAGYRRLADPSRFEDHEAYWTIVVAVRAAAFRLREGTRDVELPLRLLARHVS